VVVVVVVVVSGVGVVWEWCWYGGEWWPKWWCGEVVGVRPRRQLDYWLVCVECMLVCGGGAGDVSMVWWW
jgi:hypothetical protein